MGALFVIRPPRPVETRSAADAWHPLLAGLPPLAMLGLALITALALLALLDPPLEQGGGHQRLQVIVVDDAALMIVRRLGGDSDHLVLLRHMDPLFYR